MISESAKLKPGVDIVTGIRPTGDLTIANYLGAIGPIIELQDRNLDMMVFVADLHGLTTHDIDVVKEYSNEIIVDVLALGLDPEKTDLYIQSSIAKELSLLTMYFAKLITVSELLRVPTLKDKIKDGQKSESANTLLFLYPVLMAADILIQRALKVPVGDDQRAHIEVTRKLARRFNETYCEVFPVPDVEQVESLRILSLKGTTKMSKSYPESALFLNDAEEAILKKIKRAETAMAGVMSPSLESHSQIIRGLGDESDKTTLDQILKSHMEGKEVMSDFKDLFGDVVVGFLENFQTKRKELASKEDLIGEIINEGNTQAQSLADETMTMIADEFGLATSS